MLSRSILLMHMRAGHQMSNAYTLKEGAKLVILALLVSLDGQYFSIEETLNMDMEILNFLKNFRFVLKQLNPHKFSKITNKENIVIVSSSRREGRVQTSEKTNSMGALETLIDFGNES
jgi:hypothetical protein